MVQGVIALMIISKSLETISLTVGSLNKVYLQALFINFFRKGLNMNQRNRLKKLLTRRTIRNIKRSNIRLNDANQSKALKRKENE
jgi:hypothetical protein